MNEFCLIAATPRLRLETAAQAPPHVIFYNLNVGYGDRILTSV